MLVALAAAERFGEKFVSVGSTVSQRVHKASTALAVCIVYILGLSPGSNWLVWLFLRVR